ncbi:hypothetical protein LEQ05_05080 [Riemerella anatipestifer]|nr:hypothetical protein LEQ05_05080 [Riemerella anatipestifer]
MYGAGYQQYNASADIIKGGHFYGLSRWTSNPTEQIIGVYAEASNSKEKGLYPGQIEGTANVTNRMAGGFFYLQLEQMQLIIVFLELIQLISLRMMQLCQQE